MTEIAYLLKSIDFNWSLLEILAVIFSVVYVILAARQNILCWTFAALSVILYIYICYSANLYAETFLQVFYLYMAAYGYHNWGNSEKIKYYQLSAAKHILIIIIGGFLTFLFGFYFTTYTKAEMPIIDAFTSVFSIIATFLVIKKVLENWLYWIIIDIMSIYLYFSKELHLTSMLFVVYTMIAFFGYFSWLNQGKKNV